ARRWTRGRPRDRGCFVACARPSCVGRKILEKLVVYAAEAIGPRNRALGGRIHLHDRALAARIRDLAVAAGAEEAVDAAGGAEVLDPDIDAHGAGPEEGIEILDAEVADDVELIGIIGDVELPR